MDFPREVYFLDPTSDWYTSDWYLLIVLSLLIGFAFADWFYRRSLSSCLPPSTPLRPTVPMVIDDHGHINLAPKLCAKCSSPGCNLRCSCRQVMYCNKACQTADWSSHKKACAFHLEKVMLKAEKEHGKDSVPVAEARMRLGVCHREEGRIDLAEKSLLKAHRIFAAKCGAEDRTTARACVHLADLYGRIGKFREMFEMFSESIRIFGRTDGERSVAVAQVSRKLAVFIGTLGRHKEAIEKLDEAHSIYEETFGPEHANVALVLMEKAESYRQLGQLDRALEMSEEALRIKRRDPEFAENDGFAAALGDVGNVLFDQGRYPEAMAKFEEALAIFRRLHGDTHVHAANILVSMGNLLRRQGKYDEALKLHKRALKTWRRAFGEDHVYVADAYINIGTIAFIHEAKIDEAMEVFEAALVIYTRVLNTYDHRKIAETHFNIAQTKITKGDSAGALGNVKECLRICKKLGLSHGVEKMATKLMKEIQQGAT